MNEAAATPAEVLAFWFAPGRRKQWFAVDQAFDGAVAAALAPAAAQAAAGALETWAATADGALALVLLLDQVPRNLGRGTPAAFASDALARQVARLALRRGFDLGRTREERVFFYLPFEHSEELADQFLSEALFATLGDADWSFYARRHREIVERFGRFPHRNAALGRSTTPGEAAFLAEPHSSF